MITQRTEGQTTPGDSLRARRRDISILLVAAFAALFGLNFSCKKVAPPAPKPVAPAAAVEPKKPSTPLKVGFNQWVGFAGFFIADENGLFKKHGVEVELVPFSGPGDSIPPLLAGQIDVSLTTAHNLALMAGKQPTAAKLVYLIDASDGADAVVASHAIKSVAGLKGKKVAVTKGEINHMLLILALESAGLKEQAISLVDMSPDDAGAAFMAGKVDAAVTWEPWLTRAKEKKGHIIYSSHEPGAKDTIIDVMAASDKALAERKEDLKNFTAAFDEGVKFVTEQPAAAKAILAKRLDAKPEDIDGMLGGVHLYTLADNEKMLSDSLPATLAKVETFLKTHSLINHGIGGRELVATALTSP
jgi:NitT/TauT family transport system substrate-binding protein